MFFKKIIEILKLIRKSIPYGQKKALNVPLSIVPVAVMKCGKMSLWAVDICGLKNMEQE